MSDNATKSTVNEDLLAMILDRLIPANDDLPAAGQLGITSEIVRISAKQDRFNKLFTRAIHTFEERNPDFAKIFGEDQDERIREFESSEHDLFATLINVAYIVYYKDSRVHEKIGWSGQTPQPGGNEMLAWDESVLDNMRKREPFWRKV